MIRQGERVFVDTGAWVALALTRDPLHGRARDVWEELLVAGARLHVSIPVVIETFTFLERNVAREIALAWKDSLRTAPRLRVLECRAADLERAWAWFQRHDLHKLSAVDATSFVLMLRERVRVAFAFDNHFPTAGFRTVG